MNYNMLEQKTMFDKDKFEAFIDSFKFSKKTIDINDHEFDIKELILNHCLFALNPGDIVDIKSSAQFFNEFNSYVAWQLFNLIGINNKNREYTLEYERRNRFCERRREHHLIPMKDSIEFKYSRYENMVSYMMETINKDEIKISLQEMLFRILINICYMRRETFEETGIIPKDKNGEYPLFQSFIDTVLFVYEERHSIKSILNEYM